MVHHSPRVSVSPHGPIAVAREALRAALEQAREEVVRRLAAAGFPTTLADQQLLVIDNADATGWTTEWQEVSGSPLTSDQVSLAIRDDSIPIRLIGLRDQLQPLADLLASTTVLGDLRPRGFGRDTTGPENALQTYVQPLVIQYLESLSDVAHPDSALVEELGDQLDALIARAALMERVQLALDGVRTTEALGPYRDIRLRPLTPAERGSYVAQRFPRHGDARDFVVPTLTETLAPRVLLEYTLPAEDDARRASLANQLALAFYLRGHDIGSPGVYVTLNEPRWATFGFRMSPFVVQPKSLPAAPLIDQQEFEAIVDLAFAMPRFGGEEGGHQELALFRVLRGSGTAGSAFLDFAIALEAALLTGAKTELAYRFRLYGATFLRDKRDALTTFKQLKEVYDVRSRLVHGGGISASKRSAAESSAKDLAIAVLRKAIESGWPDQEKLDRAALGQQISSEIASTETSQDRRHDA